MRPAVLTIVVESLTRLSILFGDRGMAVEPFDNYLALVTAAPARRPRVPARHPRRIRLADPPRRCGPAAPAAPSGPPHPGGNARLPLRSPTPPLLTWRQERTPRPSRGPHRRMRASTALPLPRRLA